MFRGGRSRGGSSWRGGRTAPPHGKLPPPKKGVFADGVWLCDCKPRVPAQKFQVKKDTPNKGRWFYTCQKTDDQKCGFFLWQDQARAEEIAQTPLYKRPNPNPPSPRTPSRNPRSSPSSREITSTSRYDTPPRDAQRRDWAPTPGTTKRTRQEFEEDTQDEYGWNMAPEDMQELTKTAETLMDAPVTPAAKAAKTETFKTPGRRRLPWQDADEPSNGLPTPKTTHTIKDAFEAVTRAAARPLPAKREASPTPAGREYLALSSQTSHGRSPASTPASSPTPRRFKDNASIPGEMQEPEFIPEVMDLLKAEKVQLNESARESLYELLKRQSLRSQGLARGREVARAGLKARDAKIAELQYRISSLEAELEEKQAIISHLNWQRDNADISRAAP